MLKDSVKGPMGKGSDGKSHFIAKGWNSSADKRESGEHSGGQNGMGGVKIHWGL